MANQYSGGKSQSLQSNLDNAYRALDSGFSNFSAETTFFSACTFPLPSICLELLTPPVDFDLLNDSNSL